MVRISVIVPVYNVQDYLNTCLDSLVEQDFINFEVVCVDDGSTDNSASTLKEYAPSIKNLKIIAQENRGLSAARNTGIRNASGDYIIFLDSDDYLEKGALKKLDEICENEHPDAIAFNARIFNTDRDISKLYTERIIDDNRVWKGMDFFSENYARYSNFNLIPACFYLFKRSVLCDNNLFFREGLYHEDILFTTVALSYIESLILINSPLYNYRIREGSITKQPVTLKHLKDTLSIVAALDSFFKDQNKYVSRMIFDLFMRAVNRSIDMNCYVAILRHIRKLSNKKYYFEYRSKKARKNYTIFRISPYLYWFFWKIRKFTN